MRARPKGLDVRVHICPFYGLVLDRDVNSAIVLFRKGIGTGYADSKPVGNSASTEEKPVRHVGSMNQEAHLFRGGSSLAHA
jgi:transposase